MGLVPLGVEAGGEGQQLADLHLLVHGQGVRHQPHPRQNGWPFPLRVSPEHRHPSAVPPIETQAGANQRRLAAAIPSHQGVDGAAGDLEVESGQHGLAETEALGQPGHLEREGAVPRSLRSPPREPEPPSCSPSGRALPTGRDQGFQLLGEIVDGLPAVLRRLGQTTQDRRHEARTGPLPQLADFRRLVDDRVQQCDRRAPLECRMTRDHLCGNTPESEDVRPRVDRLAGSLLGGHVARRPQDRPLESEIEAGEELRDAEVCQPGVLAAVTLLQKDVGGLDVPMDDAVPVGMGEGAGDVDQQPEGPRRRERPAVAKGLLEAGATDQPHRHPGILVLQPGVVDGNDRRVIQPGDRPDLVFEPQDLLPSRKAALREGEDLEGYDPLELLVEDAVDPAEAALADQGLDPVAVGDQPSWVRRTRRKGESRTLDGGRWTGFAARATRRKSVVHLEDDRVLLIRAQLSNISGNPLPRPRVSRG